LMKMKVSVRNVEKNTTIPRVEDIIFVRIVEATIDGKKNEEN
jgi:hypothetical protein